MKLQIPRLESGLTAQLVHEVPDEYKYMVGPDNFLKTMRKIADITIKEDIPVVFFASDLLIYDGGEKVRDYFPQIEEMGFAIVDVDTKLVELFKENDLTYNEVRISKHDPHMNRDGHKLLAEILVSELLKLDL